MRDELTVLFPYHSCVVYIQNYRVLVIVGIQNQRLYLENETLHYADALLSLYIDTITDCINVNKSHCPKFWFFKEAQITFKIRIAANSSSGFRQQITYY
ncbi:hypothetical protein Bhyg_01133 [Pseudolycoriella hygida]|uniref:Uncharacterized protein n=1 Tax=Pseudolycoriella hygida TaxID=35572 RepID=A0A9Q0S5J8_9DIPT|nr:hypothetical protein Bhyg_01133 [Pseudolycoriella hygida]